MMSAMTPEQLEKVRERFLAYVESFGTDEGLHPMMKLKRAHTLRVARLAREIAAEMGWSGEDVRLAEAAGVLHDVGRFTQYRDHAT
jgi:HD-GYP domain-containing protein (c-di-GMP phosphodiesterase class II)